MNFKALIAMVIFAVAMSYSPSSHASGCSGVTTSTNTGTTTGNVNEDFTCNVTEQQWFFFNGACLTAGTASDTASTPVNPGVVPGCGKVMISYYNVAQAGGVQGKNADAALVGGENGYLGSTSAPSTASGVTPDDIGSGALRFTNGKPYGKQERGAIVSNYTFPTGQGVHITFKTVAYLGSKDGPLNDGADGISFYLIDGCMPIAGGTVPSGCSSNPIYGTGQTFPAIGATGGSLAYSCSNSNSPYDGLVGAYLGLGMDEWGNFLNGTNITLSETGTSATGDNTASGGGYKSGRIGLRGAGSISWQALNTAYGTDKGASNPYYPTSLSTSCSTGTAYNGLCGSCSGGTFTAGSCTGTGAYSCSSGTLAGTLCASCASGTLDTSGSSPMCDNACPNPSTQTYVSQGNNPGCYSCSNGNTPYYDSGHIKYTCTNGGTISSEVNASNVAATTVAATQVSPTYSKTAATNAVQKTCSTGKLYNYSNQSSPTDVGYADLSNSVNTAGIMDYPALFYSVIPTPTQDPVHGFLIANETAATRGAAQPILYDLKVTQDGILSLSYSYNGGTAVPVIKNQTITTSNGPLPSSFRFGFAGSTGGSTNVHEILCFKAAPVESSGSSGAINVYHNPYIRTGTQIFIANYFPSEWTGQLEAIGIGNSTTTGAPVVAQVNWDARCVLSGVNPATKVCDSTAASSPAKGQLPANRVMLTWDPVGLTGEAFQYASLTAAQQTTLAASSRVAYLRGDTTNEINSSGVGIYRKRDSILADIVDSSPNWIGPPQNPYTLISSWVDQLYPGATQPENDKTVPAQTYAQYMSKYDATKNPLGKLGRENIVFAGANDGFLHGFRAGALDINGNLDTGTYANDGQEVLAYMPAAVLNNIHPVDSSGSVIAQLDFSNSQFSHNWYVDSTPAQGDVFYGSKWHTWVVSGIGPGGAAIFALDVTDPTQFSESTPNTTVIGEWSPSTLTCANDPTTAPVTHCGAYLGNTYGAPQIRRFHNGQWGFVFGNGYGTANGASGIYIALLDKSSGAPTFYWFPTNLTFSSSTPNGISYVYSADFDLDNTVDYIYAGDLLGNIWRFDVTGNDPSQWGVSASSPLFNAGQPITTQVIAYTVKTITSVVNAVGLDISNAPERVVVIFGTGRQIPQTLNSAAIYASGTQTLYGIWDWDMAGWNTLSPHQQGIGLASSPGTITTSNLQSQTLSETPMVVAANGSTTGGTATLTKNVVCWSGGTACSGGNTMLGWYTNLPSTNEQIIYNPLANPDTGALVFNTYIPANTSVLSCTDGGATGFSLGIDPGTGGGLTTPLFNQGGTSYDGVQTNAAGSASVINSAEKGGGKYYLVTHNANGAITFTQMNTYNVTTGQRVYWIQKR